MKYLVALYSALLLAVYVSVLRYGQAMAGFGDGAPQTFNVWAISELFPFAYFLFTFGSCFFRHPGPVAIRTAIVMQIAMAIFLFQMLLEGGAIAIVFVIGLFAMWLLMFFEKLGSIHLGAKATFLGVGIVILIQISLAMVIFAVVYSNMSLGMEGLIFMGIGLLLGMVSYLQSMKFIERVRVDSPKLDPADPEGSAE